MKRKANGDHSKLHDDVFRIVYRTKNDLHLHSGFESLKNFSGLTFNKLFATDPKKIEKLVGRAKLLNVDYTADNFSDYYAINCPGEFDPEEILIRVRNEVDIEIAYIENGPIVPPYFFLNSDTQIFEQGYLEKAPRGIDAVYAKSISSGKGSANINLIDIEQGWNLSHQDISAKTFPATGFNYHNFLDHGTAVLGVILMQNKKLNRYGIAPNVNAHVVSQWRPDGYMNTADAIITAITHLNYGDILLLESQSFESVKSNSALPVEIHEAVFQAIRLATALGIIVIESAGNGDLVTRVGIDLDNCKINGERIFNRLSADFRDSGAIIVAASTSTVPHQRMHFSNYGNRIDCFAWGQNVATTGSYPHSSGNAINTYTQGFSGTSAAAAIIAGAAISIQSIYAQNNNERLSPKQMRSLFNSNSYGTPSANGTSVDKIGMMPDLKKIIDKRFNLTPTPGTTETVA